MVMFQLMWRSKLKKDIIERNDIIDVLEKKYFCREKNDVSFEENKLAKIDLLKIYKRLQKYKPSEYYRLGGLHEDSHSRYVKYLILFNKSLKDKLYASACCYLLDLASHEPIFQKRIYCNLIFLLEKHFKMNSDDI